MIKETIERINKQIQRTEELFKSDAFFIEKIRPTTLPINLAKQE